MIGKNVSPIGYDFKMSYLLEYVGHPISSATGHISRKLLDIKF